MKIISIAQHFSETPAGRYRSDGPFSGERFREEFLYPALLDSTKVQVQLDGTLGYGSSFLEEVFGGLVRENGMSFKEIKDKLEIISSRKLYLDRAWSYMRDADDIAKKT